ncbi:lipopolysaccharide heptosyltransferase I [Ralstonia mannitolilytica]|uniref:lipopolysaccharide heptosyltransferase I n=1 Tax=Ralstonia mannitolilytica TaxID=105219 RepID=UPI0005D9DB8C|nr:lipopolysaccharide heptosyltransferase I [Ralstonia mannitolilytica]AJW44573.1 glycosyl transferase family 1 [Ralstonia mannitolilytica]MBU9578546.1 lipopolysaccharide heptosyltransferase I [Ralstonia mannitolilytica]QIF06786.1 lipopolysaccharide heptosyltransferase I [Ralstonia mannitolilytica]CAJ0726641.1 Lipopolysaccharide heptosyltransferase 1 [Ralstonia mannitolilytica]CAJ0797359.1 Lipopolysaccharide heptosyltransferase 1 [Ralstonia mannitolilytica]
MRVLIVKVSSLGDVVHCTPVVADILRAHPEAEIDWVVEEGFAGIVRIVRGVREVIPFALRRWRKSLGAGKTWNEMAAFRRALRTRPYDAVLDTQGLIKTALIAAQAKLAPNGFVAGLGNRTDGAGYEPLARLFYQRKIMMEPRIHVVERSRRMVAEALGYTLPDTIDFGLQPPAELPFALPRPYVALVHATSRADKAWPEAAWVEVARELLARDYAIALPWGSEAERRTSESIREAIVAAVPGTVGRVVIPPRMSLPDVTAFLDQATAVVGVDTGLVHIAAALCKPTVALYNFTTSWRTGGYWTPNVRDLGSADAHPTSAQALDALRALGVL